MNLLNNRKNHEILNAKIDNEKGITQRRVSEPLKLRCLDSVRKFKVHFCFFLQDKLLFHSPYYYSQRVSIR